MVGSMLAKKKYGQNFLINEKIIKDIVNLLDNVKENDLIIEIGPGKGALTKYLINMPCKIKCIEIDEDMHKYLDRYESEKCSIIYRQSHKRLLILLKLVTWAISSGGRALDF